MAAGAPGAAAPLAGPLEVVFFRALGPEGETVLDPVLAEVMFVARWRQLDLRLLPSAYPFVSALGPMPVGLFAGGVVGRDELLPALAALDAGGYGAPLAAADEALRALVRGTIGDALGVLLFAAEGAWEHHTRPALVRSAPRGYGWIAAWSERRRQQRRLDLRASGAATRRDWSAAALLRLRGGLEALAARLGEVDSFGDSGWTALDACAFGHLAVLYSIPCERGSALGELLSSFPTLAGFCERAALRVEGCWPDPRTLLLALQPEERAPAAAALAQPVAPGCGAPVPAVPRGREWWETWGWSAGDGKRRVQPKTCRRPPPGWQAPAFAAVALCSVAGAVLVGCCPGSWREALAAAAQRTLHGGAAGAEPPAS